MWLGWTWDRPHGRVGQHACHCLLGNSNRLVRILSPIRASKAGEQSARQPSWSGTKAVPANRAAPVRWPADRLGSLLRCFLTYRSARSVHSGQPPSRCVQDDEAAGSQVLLQALVSLPQIRAEFGMYSNPTAATLRCPVRTAAQQLGQKISRRSQTHCRSRPPRRSADRTLCASRPRRLARTNPAAGPRLRSATCQHRLPPATRAGQTLGDG
jgi:hypothetical protein